MGEGPGRLAPPATAVKSGCSPDLQVVRRLIYEEANAEILCSELSQPRSMGSTDTWGRHWLATLWNCHDKSLDSQLNANGHLDLSVFYSEMHAFAMVSGSKYYCYSVEVADEKLHVHLYIELERSIRWSTLRNKLSQFSPGAHLESRRGFRSTARDYSRGLDKGHLKPSCITSGEWGIWRTEYVQTKHDPADEIIELIMHEAKTPSYIAKKYPRYFMNNGHKIIRLYEAISCRPWLRSGQ